MAADARGGSNTDHPAFRHVPAAPSPVPEKMPAPPEIWTSPATSLSQGSGAASTIIDGNKLDRVFQVLSGNVSISKVTVQHGRVNGEGGGILNSGGRVTLSSVSIVEQHRHGHKGPATASAGGAGSPNGGAGGDGGDGTPGQGGGVFNAAGSLSLVGSQIASNQAIGGDRWQRRKRRRRPGRGRCRQRRRRPGHRRQGGRGGNGGAGQGGGIFNAPGASLTISASTISSNLAQGGDGGGGGGGGGGVGGNGGNGGFCGRAAGTAPAAQVEMAARPEWGRAADCSTPARRLSPVPPSRSRIIGNRRRRRQGRVRQRRRRRQGRRRHPPGRRGRRRGRLRRSGRSRRPGRHGGRRRRVQPVRREPDDCSR